VPNDAPIDAGHIREYFRQPNPHRTPAPLPGERLATGLKASPGRAVGIALFGTERRTPTDFDGAVLISPTVQPEDSTFLYHARGIVSTGGGILSHAGLIATQFHKPALIISGNWHREPDGSLTLLYRTLEYRDEEQEVGAFRVRIRQDMREREYRLQEGDLVVLEADEGLLRVLGQGLEALALHHGLRLFNQATSQLVHTTDEQDILRLRGIRLREFYQLKKLLGRLSSSVLGCHAAMELLLGETAMQDSGSLREQTQLLHLLRANPRIGQSVHDYMLEMVRQVQQKYQARQQRARQHMPTTLSLCEALALRMEVLHLRQALDSIRSPLLECGLQIPELDAHEAIALDGQVRRRLLDLRKTWFRQARECIQESGKTPRLRHLLRQLERAHDILSTPQHDQDATKQLFDRLSADDRTARERAAEKLLITPEDGGFEIYPLIGWKAANLAEVGRLCGPSLVPNWLVISHRAFE
jgi:phosphohistidine swiveling domain-containing protein